VIWKKHLVVYHNKLQYYGITALIYMLIQSYLTGRYHCVVINSKISTHNIYSKRGTSSKSVSQGFILGSLLFLIYIKDLWTTSNENATLILFASDTSLFITTSNLIDLGKNTIETFKQLLKWFNSNLLSPHLKKHTHFIHFKTINSPILDIQNGYHNN